MAFSTTHRARGVASGVSCRSPPIGFKLSLEPRTRCQVPCLPWLRQKPRLPGNQDAFPRRVVPPPIPHQAQPWPCTVGGTGSQTTRHRNHDVSTGDRLSAAFHHPCTRQDGQTQAHSWASLRLALEGHLDRTPLVDFCNQKQSTSTTLGPPDPRRVRLMGRLQLALDWEETSERGWGPVRHVNRRLRVTSQHLGRSGLTTRGDGSAGCQPSFHGSGAGQLSLPGASHRPLESRRRSFSPTGFTRTPLVAKSLRSWKENPAPSIARPRPTNTFPAISPRKPCLLSKQKDVGLRGLHSDCFREADGPTRRRCVRFHGPGAQSDGAPACFAGRRIPGQGPLQPNLREEIRNPLHPRCLPPMSYRPINPRLSPGSTF